MSDHDYSKWREYLSPLKITLLTVNAICFGVCIVLLAFGVGSILLTIGTGLMFGSQLAGAMIAVFKGRAVESLEGHADLASREANPK